jgi:hypothetical protein
MTTLSPRQYALPSFSCLCAISLRESHRGCCIGDLGEEVKQTDFTHAHRREYRRKEQLCLDVIDVELRGGLMNPQVVVASRRPQYL